MIMAKKRIMTMGAALFAALWPAAALAQEEQSISAGDTAFVLTSAAMVLFMTVGLGFFYGGLVRRKNILSVLMQCMFMMCLISVVWVLYGYSLAFGPSVGGFIGSLDWVGLKGVGLAPSDTYGVTVPHFAFMTFQGMFAIITPALIVGAFAERMRFAGFVVFSILWVTFIYAPVCHWVWGSGGFLLGMGALDFAGGTVVHINAGIAAVVTAIVLGKRSGYPERTSSPHHIPFVVLGAGILWFGWFGFNAGSALGANGLAAGAFVATNTAAAAGGLAWAVIEWIRDKKPTSIGVATGVVAGLVAITPAAGFVGPVSAILIGAGSSIIGFIGVAFLKPRFGYDDSLDAFGVHGLGGIWGALATGLFASKAVNPAGADGLFFGNAAQFGIQAVSVAVTIVYALIGTFVICKVVDAVIGLRVSAEEERIGLDLTQHHESGYTVLD
jgi:Amt family ammonium transporter